MTEQLPGVDTTRPSMARVYDYWLGGKDNYEVDRLEAHRLERDLPTLPRIARQNRDFHRRAVTYLTGIGVDQFLDLGAGLPTANNTHDIAQAINPSARVAYIDSDPMVLVHGRAILTAGKHTAMVEADLRAPHAVLNHPAVTDLLDFTRPVGLLLVSVLHFVPGQEPYQIVQELRDRVVPGSHIVISHALRTPQTSAAAAKYQAADAEVRGRDQIAALFNGFELVEPGLVPLTDWRPDRPPHPDTEPLPFLCGVGRK
ncbi:SAM-dependent methyltransferase [Actinomadura miaoliensis]|uniref:SAM-dependent methyltransferase n=1 Tax=Actinomadura miaoliensis TaxID=430685 RepID=A0ABP7W8Q8_9ACTN